MRALRFPQAGLTLVIATLVTLIAVLAGSHVDRVSGTTVNSFLNPGTVVQVLTDTSFFAILALGIAVVVLTGGIDLSVGSTYALSGVLTALVLRGAGAATWPPAQTLVVALSLCLGIGLVAGLANGVMVAHLGVHPFVITLGTMWVYRGIAFVVSHAESVLVPTSLTGAVKANLGWRADLYLVPFLVMAVSAVVATLFLGKTVAGRNVYAVGGNAEAAHLSGVRVPRILVGVYALCGLAAGLAAFMGAGYYGSASCSDGQGYELYAIAAAVVGGVSLNGGRGTALGACLGALLIVLFRQAVVTLHLDTKYEWVIIGLAIIVAVLLERLTRGRKDPGRTGSPHAG